MLQSKTSKPQTNDIFLWDTAPLLPALRLRICEKWLIVLQVDNTTLSRFPRQRKRKKLTTVLWLLLNRPSVWKEGKFKKQREKQWGQKSKVRKIRSTRIPGLIAWRRPSSSPGNARRSSFFFPSSDFLPPYVLGFYFLTCSSALRIICIITNSLIYLKIYSLVSVCVIWYFHRI